jgi:ribosomal protein S18 acetylase RimI-like enzyme
MTFYSSVESQEDFSVVISDCHTESGLDDFVAMLVLWRFEAGRSQEHPARDDHTAKKEDYRQLFSQNQEDTIAFIAYIKKTETDIYERAGFIWLKKYRLVNGEGIRGFVNEFWVAPEFRSWGIGQVLMNQALKWMSDNGVSDVCLNVNHFNRRAISFYEKFGFIRQRASYYHYYFKEKPSFNFIPGVRLQLRTSPKYDSAIWRYSEKKFLADRGKHYLTTKQALQAFKYHKQNSEFGEENSIVVLALDPDLTLLGYAWGNEDRDPSDYRLTFTVQEFFCINAVPDPKELCRAILGYIFGTAFDLGIQDQRAVAVDSLGAQILLELNFTPSNYQMVLKMNTGKSG